MILENRGWEVNGLLIMKITRPKGHESFIGIKEALISYLGSINALDTFAKQLITFCVTYSEKTFTGIVKLVERIYIRNLNMEPATVLLNMMMNAMKEEYIVFSTVFPCLKANVEYIQYVVSQMDPPTVSN